MLRFLVHRFLTALAGLLLTAGSLRADRMAELIEIHIEAIGGRARIEALRSLRASGLVFVADQPVRFLMIAARPNRVRLETGVEGRMVVQGFDGAGPVWELDSKFDPPRLRPMAARAAKTFVADAEFDDPLIGGASRRYTCDYAGEVDRGGQKYVRVMVTRDLTETHTLLIDARTFFIVSRIEQRASVSGRKLQVVTEYADFRPVEGVLLAHQIEVRIDGRVTQRTRIERIEANPELTEDAFSRPKVPAAAVP